jgi:hypothetical protein
MRNIVYNHSNVIASGKLQKDTEDQFDLHGNSMPLPEILLISSYPPRECGIATYSQDLIKALNNQFSNSFNIRICALASENEKHIYPEEVKHILDTDRRSRFP